MLGCSPEAAFCHSLCTNLSTQQYCTSGLTGWGGRGRTRGCCAGDRGSGSVWLVCRRTPPGPAPRSLSVHSLLLCLGGPPACQVSVLGLTDGHGQGFSLLLWQVLQQVASQAAGTAGFGSLCFLCLAHGGFLANSDLKAFFFFVSDIISAT